MNSHSKIENNSTEKYERRSDRRKTLTIQPYNDLIVCIPCYNEAERLKLDVFVSFLNKYTDIQFLFINDGSSDNTGEILDNFVKKFPRQTRLLNLPKNVGKAEAVRQGLLSAIDMDKAFVGYWDADLATDLSAILDFARIMREKSHINVVMGARLKLMGHQVNREFKRLLVSKICNVLAKAALRQNFRDTQCGAKLLRNTPELKAILQLKFETPWLFDVELFKRLKSKSLDKHIFYEYPLSRWEEIAGSKIELRTIVNSGVSMLKLIIGK